MNTVRADKAHMQLVRQFPLVPLREKSEFESAVRIMKQLAYRRNSLSPGVADYLAVLGDLIAQYEKRLPRLAEQMSPREALIFLMESNSLVQADIVDCVGYESNLFAFLNGHRELSKRAACRLADFFKVSPALFLSKD